MRCQDEAPSIVLLGPALLFTAKRPDNQISKRIERDKRTRRTVLSVWADAWSREGDATKRLCKEEAWGLQMSF